jgi:methylation protein EvaC
MTRATVPVSKCLVSGADTEPFLSFGQMPIANGFLEPKDVGNEYFFELEVGYCPESKMVQLTQLVEKERLFHDHYAFFSSTSRRMTEHFERFASGIRERWFENPSEAFVVEIGSNDGIMLQNFARAKTRHLGIEPSKNVAEAGRARGVNTISEFFDETLAQRIVDEYGQADAFLGANVMCHIAAIHPVAAGIRRLLKPKGVLVFEDPYLGDIVEKTSYDQIYDEHAFYFSVASVSHLFGMHGLELIDVEPQTVHGGSMRYVIAHRGAHPVSERVARQEVHERALGLDRPETYSRFADAVRRSRDELMALLGELKRTGRRVAAYGATSKSTTVTNFAGITPDLVEYISDTTPIKQGKLSPGVHIPVVPYERFSGEPPEYALLFAWNHAQEILAKEKGYTDRGGKFILYVPRVHTL